jgi:hypothetical protein
MFKFKMTETEKQAAQNARILRERPWLWSLLQVWNDDCPYKLEVRDLLYGADSATQLIGTMLANCGRGFPRMTAVAYCRAGGNNFEQVIICSETTPNKQWAKEVRAWRELVREIAVLDSSQQWLVIFRVNNPVALDKILKDLSPLTN